MCSIVNFRILFYFELNDSNTWFSGFKIHLLCARVMLNLICRFILKNLYITYHLVIKQSVFIIEFSIITTHKNKFIKNIANIQHVLLLNLFNTTEMLHRKHNSSKVYFRSVLIMAMPPLFNKDLGKNGKIFSIGLVINQCGLPDDRYFNHYAPEDWSGWVDVRIWRCLVDTEYCWGFSILIWLCWLFKMVVIKRKSSNIFLFEHGFKKYRI